MSEATDTPDEEHTVEDQDKDQPDQGEDHPGPDEQSGPDESGDDKPASASTGLKADLRKARDQRDEARAELEQVQAHLEAARQQVDQVQVDRVDEIITAHGYTPAVLWKLGLDLADIRDDDGNIDADLVGEQVKNLVTEYKLGGRLGGPPKFKPTEALRPGAPENNNRAELWSDTLKGKAPRR